MSIFSAANIFEEVRKEERAHRGRRASEYSRTIAFSQKVITHLSKNGMLSVKLDEALSILSNRRPPTAYRGSHKTKEEQTPNKGTGAGGSNTNKNGLPYEILTELNTEYTVIAEDSFSKNVKFNTDDKIYKFTKKSKLFKSMKDSIDSTVKKAHGCKNPDECYIDETNNIIFIIEKKFQQVSGSVCEKIQTPHFKIWQYNRTFPKHKIVYIYCLSDWFKLNCEAALEYLKEQKIPVFWGNYEDYKSYIITFITNFSS